MATPNMRSNSDATVSLWTARLDEWAGAMDLARWAHLLSDEEQARWQRLVRPASKEAFLVSRVLLRSVLGRETGQSPSALRFVVGPQGKPALADDGPRRLAFNLSHTNGLVVLASSWTHELGVDAEDMAERPAPLSVAERYFADEEWRAMQALPDQASRDARFWRLWTLKEAHVKALGSGLFQQAFGGAVFDIPAGNGAAGEDRLGYLGWRVPQPDPRPDQPSHACDARRRWFAQWQPTARHLAALCVLGHDGPAPAIQAHAFRPSLETPPLPWQPLHASL